MWLIRFWFSEVLNVLWSGEVDDSEVYPRGVGPVLYDLMHELAPNNRRITSLEAGANHIVVLDSSGEVYTCGK